MLKSIEDLFFGLLQDVYFAEKQLAKTLGSFAQASADPALRETFARHRFEALRQIGRLDRVFEMVGRRARGRHCDAILAILAEAERVITRTAAGGVRDAGLLAAAQAAKHYEIARYGALIAWAEQLGEKQAGELLHRTLEEEKAAEDSLDRITADRANRGARAA